MRNPEIWIGLIILGFLLFGAKKMPDAARGLGRSMRIFKSEIKGMQDEMADSQWNFGNIKLPTPYQMRRYIEERRQQFRNEMDAAAAGRSFGASSGPASGMGGSVVTNNNETTIQINGADLVEVKRIIREVVGGRASLNRTTGARRR